MTFLTEEIVGEGGEWESVHPCVLQLKGSVAVSEKRSQKLGGEKGKGSR